MSDIVERLQEPVMLRYNPEQINAERREAADEIERLLDIIEEYEHSSSVADIRAATIEECARAIEAQMVEGQCGENNETCAYLAELVRALQE